MKKLQNLILLSGIFLSIGCQRGLNKSIEPTEMKNTISSSASLNWDYPVKPGSSQWKSLNSNEEKVNVCQIPENILSQLSTKDLLAICLAYPLINDIYAFNNIETGTNKLFKDFNGLRELAKRTDALNKFMDEYNQRMNSIKALEEKNYTEYAKGEFIVGLSTMEVISTRKEMLKNARTQDITQLMHTLLEGYELKKNNPEKFKGIGFQANLLSRASLIAFRQNIPIDNAIMHMNFDATTIDKIDQQSKTISSDIN